MEIYIPRKIKELMGSTSYVIDDIGRSDSTVIMLDDMVLKIEKVGASMEQEIKMMKWLDGKLPVPKIICHVVEKDVSYLLMSKATGAMACDSVYLEQPELLLKLLADALKMIWSVDISNCPVHQDLERELSEAQVRVEKGLVNINEVEPQTFGEGGFESPSALLEWLKENKPPCEPVLSHGDFCLPNIFFDNNNLSGLIDLGGAGVGDKWRDISLCCRSIKHNLDGTYGGKVYGEFDPDMFFKALDIEPDNERLRYWFLLDELF